jgi:coproporphyrinogen III oxidase
MDRPNVNAIRDYLLGLQDRICGDLEREDDGGRFAEQRFDSAGGALARPRVLTNGKRIEKAAVHFTHSIAPRMPAAATERRPELEGRSFQALAVSLIVHPRNPYVPTSHMNVRFFLAGEQDESAIWWFGGGFDLTPVYGFDEDAVHWHQQALAACEPFGTELYPNFKKAADEYFYLPHRDECRGIGGLFFDDFDGRGFDHAFGFMRSVGDHYLDAYLPILRTRADTPFGEREREFQLYRRGRYVEFNLVYDRGTRYGMQSGRRVESVLASMPPLVSWEYERSDEPGSPEADLARFLEPRDWLGGGPA